MEQYGIRTHPGDRLGIEDIGIFQEFIPLGILEALLLDAGIVDDMRFFDHLVQFLVPGVSGPEIRVRDLKFVRSDEVQGNIRKVPQKGGERVNRATVPEIPHERDGNLLGL